MNMRKIDITEIEGFRLGNAENKAKGTGCTAIICEEGAVGGVDVRGGAPATRETDLLRSENTVESVNAVVLSGGSAFGLESASGVMRALSGKGIGYKLFGTYVPIVCGASLFDLPLGDPAAFPDVAMGMEAARNAYRGGFKTGNCGAGTGASVGKYLGPERAMKTGLGAFACEDGPLQVGAIAAVNACGDIYSNNGKIIAGMRDESGNSIYGTINALKTMVLKGTAADVNTEGSVSPGQRDGSPSMSVNDKAIRRLSPAMSRIAEALENEFEKRSMAADRPEDRYAQETASYTSSSAQPEDVYLSMFEGGAQTADIHAAGHHHNAAEESAEPEAVVSHSEDAAASDMSGGPAEDHGAVPDDISAEPESAGSEARGDDDEALGYDIPFNTTVSCLITNAKLTKSQANKLASVLHDAYARAIKPVHGTQDGDTIFVLAAGKVEVDFDAFAALSTDVLQYAVLDGAYSAKSAYGLPSAMDMLDNNTEK